jgi:hypothetical protein
MIFPVVVELEGVPKAVQGIRPVDWIKENL